MIQLSLNWQEVLWWLQGGMAGSHLRWSVYEDMVNHVWPQASEQERRNMFLIMRRDFGTCWRPDGWNGHAQMEESGEGQWREDIFDDEPLKHFRHVLARFDPNNQYAVKAKVRNSREWNRYQRIMPQESIIERPSLAHIGKDTKWESDTATMTVRTYKWQNQYRLDWSSYCGEHYIVRVDKLDIPENQ